MSPAQPPGPAPAVVPTAAVQEAQQASGEMRQWTSAAILGNGRRCPNAALPGSRYCGLDAHQALTNKDTDRVGA